MKKNHSTYCRAIVMALVLCFAMHSAAAADDPPPAPAADSNPQAEPASDQPIIIRPVRAKMSLLLPRFLLQDVGEYWIYVERRIQARKTTPKHFVVVWTGSGRVFMDKKGVAARSIGGAISESRRDVEHLLYEIIEFQVAPGTYQVELAVDSKHVHKSERSEFALTFASRKVKVEAGLPYETQYSVPMPRIAMYSPVARGGWSWDAATARKKYLERVERFEKTARRVAADPVVLALANAKPPAKSVVWLDLPEEYGGPREFDAVQVRLIVAHLRQQYWGWYYAHPFAKSVNLEAEYEQLSAAVSQQRQAIDRLGRIARMLEPNE